VEKIVQIPVNALIRRATFVALIAAAGLLAACGPDTDKAAGEAPASEAAKTEVVETTEAVETAATDEQQSANRITREGVVVEFLTKPTSPDKDQVMASDWADVTGGRDLPHHRRQHRRADQGALSGGLDGPVGDLGSPWREGVDLR
jgi:hypothetical protein